MRLTEHPLPTVPGPACVDASSSLELKKLAAYNRLIAYPRRADPRGSEVIALALAGRGQHHPALTSNPNLTHSRCSHC